jgi:hypothetical protein
MYGAIMHNMPWLSNDIKVSDIMKKTIPRKDLLSKKRYATTHISKE